MGMFWWLGDEALGKSAGRLWSYGVLLQCSVAQDQHPIGGLVRLLPVMRGKANALLLALQSGQQIGQPCMAFPVQTGKRLIHE